MSNSSVVDFSALQRQLNALRVIAPEQQLTASENAIKNVRNLLDLLESTNAALKKIWSESSDAAARCKGVQDATALLFETVHVGFNWLNRAYSAHRGDPAVLDLLHVIRTVPSAVAEVLQRSKALKDASLQKGVLELCLKHTRAAGYGRRSGDVKTMHHNLDLIFQMNKVKVALRKQGMHNVDAAITEWLQEFRGGNADAGSANEYGKSFLTAKTQEEFMSACFMMIHDTNFEADEESAMSLPCSSVLVEAAGSTKPLQAFANELGIGRFSINIFGCVGDTVLWLDIPFWNILKISCQETSNASVTVEFSVQLTADLKTFLKEVQLPAPTNQPIRASFQIAYDDGPENLQECLDRRRFWCSRIQRVAVVREPVDVSISPSPAPEAVPLSLKQLQGDLAAKSSDNAPGNCKPKGKPEEQVGDDFDFSQDPTTRKKAQTSRAPTSPSFPASPQTKDSGKDISNQQTRIDHDAPLLEKGHPVVLADKNEPQPGSYSMKSTIRELQAFALAHHPEVYKEFFGENGRKPKKAEILRALDAAQLGTEHAETQDKSPDGPILASETKAVAPDEEADLQLSTPPEARPVMKMSKGSVPSAASSTNDDFDFAPPMPQLPTASKQSAYIAREDASPPRKPSKGKMIQKNVQRDLIELNTAHPDEFDFLGSSESLAKPLKGKPDQAVSLEAAAGAAKRRLDDSKRARGLSQLDSSDAAGRKGGQTRPRSEHGSTKQDRDALAVPDKKMEAPRLKLTAAESKTSLRATETPSYQYQAPPSSYVTPALAAEARSLISPPVRPFHEPASTAEGYDKRRRRSVALLGDIPEKDNRIGGTRKRLIDLMNQPSNSDDDSLEEEYDEHDFESQDVREDVILECDRSARAIRRVVQKVNARKLRCSKQIERRVRRVLTEAETDVDTINQIRQRFLAAVHHYEKLVQAKKERAQHRERLIAERASVLEQIRSDTDRIAREMDRLLNEAGDASKRFAASLKENANKQLNEIQKMVQKQKKEAKEWKNLR